MKTPKEVDPLVISKPDINEKEKRMRNIIIVLAVLLAAVLLYALAAANTVPDTGAGEGSGDVSGYSIENVTWMLNAGDPTTMDGVSFDTTAIIAGVGAPSDVQINVDGTWDACVSPGATYDWDCTFSSPVSVDLINSLQVVAVE